MQLAIKVILSIAALLACSFGGFYYFYTSCNNGYKGDFKETTPGAGHSPKKAIIIFQPSKDGISAGIARQIAKGMSGGGYEVTITYPGNHLPSDLKDYDIIAFGSPVYFGTVSSTLTEYIKKAENLSNKKIALYSVGNLPESKEIEILEKCLGSAKPYRKEKFIATDGASPERAYQFGIDILK